jgi:hypothetical protein
MGLAFLVSGDLRLTSESFSLEFVDRRSTSEM